MTASAPIPPAALEALAKALGDFMTGSQIGTLLAAHGFDEVAGGPTTKWRRLLQSFERRQARDRSPNGILAATRDALAPARFLGRTSDHESARSEVNRALAFVGLQVNDRGDLHRVAAASTINEAHDRAGRLRSELERRRVHADVLRHCRSEFLQENYFHAVLEATKSVASKLRTKSGLTSDGSELVDAACGLGKTGVPLVAFNSLRTDSEQSEHKGVASLLRGMFGTFRNTTAHAPKIDWEITEDDALDLLTLASMLHRRLDAAARTHRIP